MKAAQTAVRPQAQRSERPRSLSEVNLRNTIFLRLFLATIPLHLTPAFNDGLMNIPWLRISAILTGLMFVEFLVSFRPKRRLDSPERTGLILFLLYMGIFTVTFARSIPNLHVFASVDPTFSYKTSTYIDSLYLLNSLAVLPFVYVVMNATSLEELYELVRAIAVGISIESLLIIGFILQDPSVLTSFDRLGISKITLAVFGLHYNDVATSYILTGPLLLYMALRRGGYWILPYALSFVAILLLESRTGLEVFFLMSLATLAVMRRTNILIIIVPLVALGIFVTFGSILLSFLSIGFTSHQGFSLNDALTGRSDFIWAPVLKEWSAKPRLFWFGGGEFAIIASYSRISGATLDVSQAHNAFLEFFLDAGLIVFVLFTGTISYYTWKGWKWARAHNNRLFWVLLFGWIGFLISCMTGRRFFPHAENWLVFPLLAMLVNIVRLTNKAEAARAVLRRGPRPLAGASSASRKSA